MNEVERLLKDRLKKELLDVIEYSELYEIVNYYDKQEIERIAIDEFRHAQHIECMMEDREIKSDDEIKELWFKAKKCFETDN